MRTPLLHLSLTMSVALMLTSCVTSPSPEKMRQRAENNRWELAHWAIAKSLTATMESLSFLHSRMGEYRAMRDATITIRESLSALNADLSLYRGLTTRMAYEPRRMMFESDFIRAFEASTRYRLDGESLSFESDIARPLEFYRRPLDR